MKKKDIIKIEQVEEKILMLRGVRVIIDADVAALYGVETREINQAVKNNPKKFPKGYVIELETNDLEILRSKILIAKLNPKSRYHPQVERTGENLQRGRIRPLIKTNRAATLMPLRVLQRLP